MENSMNLKKSIKVALAQKEMTASDLADKMCVSKAYISKLMTVGSMNTRTLNEIAGILDIKVSEFVALGE